MKQWVLVRINETGKYTQGVLMDPEGRRFSYTLEPPWKMNAKDVSSIPEGIYLCAPTVHHTKSGKSYDAYEVLGVKDRTDINIHIGNYPRDTHGCILLGDGLGPGIVYDSRSGFERFMNIMNGEDFYLLVTDNSYLSTVDRSLVPEMKVKFDLKKQVIASVERVADREDHVSFWDKVVHYTPRGFKRVTGAVSVVTGLLSGQTNAGLGKLLIAFGIIAVIVGVLHAIARKSTKYNVKGEFWVSDLAKWLLDYVLKKKAR